MKKNLKLFGSAIALCFAVIACEKKWSESDAWIWWL